MNPIMQMMNGSNPVGMILQALDGGMNPQAMAAQIMQQNPQAAAMVQEMQRNMGGRSPKELALEYCRSQGIDEDQVIGLAQRMGIR